MDKDFLMEMDKEQLVSYVNLMLDTIMDLENRLQGVYKYVDRMSFAPVVNNPKEDSYRLLKREEKENEDGLKRRK